MTSVPPEAGVMPSEELSTMLTSGCCPLALNASTEELPVKAFAVTFSLCPLSAVGVKVGEMVQVSPAGRGLAQVLVVLYAAFQTLILRKGAARRAGPARR